MWNTGLHSVKNAAVQAYDPAEKGLPLQKGLMLCIVFLYSKLAFCNGKMVWDVTEQRWNPVWLFITNIGRKKHSAPWRLILGLRLSPLCKLFSYFSPSLSYKHILPYFDKGATEANSPTSNRPYKKEWRVAKGCVRLQHCCGFSQRTQSNTHGRCMLRSDENKLEACKKLLQVMVRTVTQYSVKHSYWFVCFLYSLNNIYLF